MEKFQANDKSIPLERKMSNRIQNQRQNQKATQKDIAVNLNISHSVYKKIESCENKFISVSLLEKLAKRFGCTYDYLALKSDDPATFSDGRQLCCNFKSKNEMLQTVVTYFEGHDDISFLRDLSYAITNLPEDCCQSLQDILHHFVLLHCQNK